MTEGVDRIRGIGPGADDTANLHMCLGAFAFSHVASGERPACHITIEDGDMAAMCEDKGCFDRDPDVTALVRVLHFAPDMAWLGPARNGWTFSRKTPAARWMMWSPDRKDPVEVRRSQNA